MKFHSNDWSYKFLGKIAGPSEYSLQSTLQNLMKQNHRYLILFKFSYSAFK